MVKYIGFCVYHRSYQLWPPVIVCPPNGTAVLKGSSMDEITSAEKSIAPLVRSQLSLRYTGICCIHISDAEWYVRTMYVQQHDRSTASSPGRNSQGLAPLCRAVLVIEG